MFIMTFYFLRPNFVMSMVFYITLFFYIFYFILYSYLHIIKFNVIKFYQIVSWSSKKQYIEENTYAYRFILLIIFLHSLFLFFTLKWKKKSFSIALIISSMFSKRNISPISINGVYMRVNINGMFLKNYVSFSKKRNLFLNRATHRSFCCLKENRVNASLTA